jgi:WD40 repeat protein
MTTIAASSCRHGRFSHGGHWIAISTATACKVYATYTCSLLVTLPVPNVTHMAWSEHDACLISATGHGNGTGEVSQWAVPSGTCLHSVAINGTITALAVVQSNERGCKVAVGTADGRLLLVDTAQQGSCEVVASNLGGSVSDAVASARHLCVATSSGDVLAYSLPLTPKLEPEAVQVCFGEGANIKLALGGPLQDDRLCVATAAGSMFTFDIPPKVHDAQCKHSLLVFPYKAH